MTVGELMQALRDWPDAAEVEIMNTAGRDDKLLIPYAVVHESTGKALILADPES